MTDYTHTLQDTVEDDEFTNITGKFSAASIEGGSITYTVASTGGGAAVEEDISQSGYTHRVNSTYGTLYYNTNTGDYKYEPDVKTVNSLGADSSVIERFSVTAKEGTRTPTEQNLEITITGADDKPVFNDLEGDFTIAEDVVGSSSAVNIGRPIMAIDPEGHTITYMLKEGAPAGFEIVSGSTGVQIRYTGSSLDYETNPTITLTVVANSSGGETEQDVTITVRDINETEYSAQVIEDSPRFSTTEGRVVTESALTSATYSLSVQRSDGTTTSISADKTNTRGTYGMLKVDRDGTWEYTLNNSNAVIN